MRAVKSKNTSAEEVNVIVKKLESRSPLPPLHPEQIWSKELDSKIADLKINDVIKSGLHLWNDDIDRAHKLAQEIPGSEGSFWHAILHRRGRDFSNSKYWYRQVGNHPVNSQVRKDFPDWDPFRFVDLCAQNVGTSEKDTIENLQKIQLFEIKSLLSYVLKKYM